MSSSPSTSHPTSDASTASTDIGKMVEGLRNKHLSQATKPYEWRYQQLKNLKSMLTENTPKIYEALEKDLKSNLMLKNVEVRGPLEEVETAMNNLKSWMEPKHKSNSLIMYKPGSAMIVREPYGVVLIISPWNYPVSLIVKPLVGAISAGNCVVIKPSEVSSNVELLMSELIPKYLDQECIRCVCGGPSVSSELLSQKFDYIFFTGSTSIGKIVMEAASKHLTPVTLELGGKTPCIVDEELDLDTSVNRICFGKFMNSGQTCVAPDYLLLHQNISDKFVKKLKETINSFYTSDPLNCKDIGKVINQKNFDRLVSMIEEQPKEKIIFGGKYDKEKLMIEPTVILGPDLDSKIMTEEIFGPVLPIISISNIGDAIQFIKQRPKPLALYIFSSNTKNQDLIIYNTSSGGVSINETILHVGHPELPFGGVGESGMGSYNGKKTFKTFSHAKSIYSHSTWMDPASRYPPYDESKLKFMKVAYGPIGVSMLWRAFSSDG